MKEIRVRVISTGFEGTVKVFGGNDRALVELTNGLRYWYSHSDLSVIVDSEEIGQYIAKNMNTVFAIKDPKGILGMRQVRIVVGEGTDKVEVGVAEIQPVPDDDTKVVLTITDERIAKMLGGNKIEGTIPRHVELPEEDTNG